MIQMSSVPRYLILIKPVLLIPDCIAMSSVKMIKMANSAQDINIFIVDYE